MKWFWDFLRRLTVREVKYSHGINPHNEHEDLIRKHNDTYW